MAAAGSRSVILATSLILASATVHSADQPLERRSEGFLDDLECYATAPIRWDDRDWLYFGGAVAAVGLSHRYDEEVRKHFAGASPPPATQSYDTEDALPAIGVFAATLLYATLTNNHDGQSESWQMVEAAGFTTATTYLLKYAGGRERPNETNDPNQWRVGGESFPSGHTSVAFAIGTVLAESGDEKYRWLRRLVGYGMAGYTGYARLKHDAHWLSDTVAGAAIGISTAQFVMNRQTRTGNGEFSWVPLDRGLVVSYSVALP